ncbi:MAG: NADH-quinone oxidoreductase subunit C, partial [Vulcanimicrobiaceae bacterium]
VVRVTPQTIIETLRELKAAGFSQLTDVGGVDYLERTPRYDVVYHLTKLPTAPASIGEVGTPERVRILCGVPGEEPEVPTAVALWPSADWAEREIFDLFGIVFTGHPDLRRIQMPDEWEGYPLRKDYPLRGPARERTPRPSFALKSNVAAGTPASGRAAAALQRQLVEGRKHDALTVEHAAQTAQAGVHPGAGVTAGDAKASELAERPVNLNTKDQKPQ